jgi:DNA-binding response OmpR family regulator
VGPRSPIAALSPSLDRKAGQTGECAPADGVRNGNTFVTDGNVASPPDNARAALVLHDRTIVVDLIELTLNHGLFVVRAAHNLAEAEGILGQWRPDIAVVDMDHDDSADLLKRLGASNTLRRSLTPVLGLTRRGDLATKLKAFDLGVDDILTVPFSPEELLARSIVISRRASGTDRPIIPTIKLGEMEIDILRREVRAGTSIVHLSGIEQSLLYLLASRGGRVISRDEILDAVWGTDFVAESNIVDRHIRTLRIKLQNDYRRPRFIATVPGKGYRFLPVFSNRGWDVQGDSAES